MKNYFSFWGSCCLFLLFSLFSCTDDTFSEGENRKTVSPDVEGKYVRKGFIRIRLQESAGKQVRLSAESGKIRTGLSGLDELADRLGATRIERVFPDAGRFEARSRAAGLHLWYNVYFNDSLPVSRAVSGFSEISGIDCVEPVREVRRIGGGSEIIPLGSAGRTSDVLPFNDPFLPNQWHYHNDGRQVSDAVAGADIALFEAWKLTTGSPEVIVAVVDGGVDYEHEDLKANMWRNEEEASGIPGRDDDGNGYKDDVYGWNFVDNNASIVPHGHGTHVAGTIAAVNGNNRGVCGIAGGNSSSGGVRIISCQIFKTDPDDPDKDINTDNIPRAIKYGADNGAVISQNSWSYLFEEGETPYLDGATKAAIDYFIENAGKDENGNQTGPMNGGIVIFAAGNEDKDYSCYPAAYAKVLSVAAMAPDFKKTWYSNYSAWVDVTAPGGTSPRQGRYAKGCMVASTYPGNEYVYMEGTSMACPHVSGIAALAVSYLGVGQPGFTPEELRKRLLEGTRDIDVYNPAYRGRMGVGYIDAALVLQTDRGIAPDPVTDLKAVWGSVYTVLNWSVTRDEDNGVPDHYDVYLDTLPLADRDLTGMDVKETVGVARKKAGDKVEITLRGLLSGTPYYVAVVGVDRFGNRSAAAFGEGITLEGGAPVITPEFSGELVFKAHETAVLTFGVTDPDGQAWTYVLTGSTDGISAVRSGKTLKVTLEAPRIGAGTHSFALTVTDEEGMSSVLELTFRVLDNHPPLLQEGVTPEDMYFEEIGGIRTLDLNRFFRDADGEELFYKAGCSVEGLLRTDIVGGQLTLTSLKAGQGELTLTATDGLGASCAVRVRVLVRNGKRAADFYPNPVKDKLNIRMGKDVEGNIAVKIYNAGGTLVLETVAPIAPFKPAVVGMERLAGGSYLVVVRYKDTEVRSNVVKL